MIAVDTSVVVAGFASWHADHLVARRAIASRPRLPAPVAVESLAVLTRLPAPHRVPAPLVAEYLEANFPDAMLALPPTAYRGLLRTCARLGITGGAVHDAVVAATAARAGATLLSLDRRARRTYEALGVDVRFLAATGSG